MASEDVGSFKAIDTLPPRTLLPILPSSESLLGASPAWVRRSVDEADLDREDENSQDALPWAGTNGHEAQFKSPTQHSTSSHQHPFFLSPAPRLAVPAISILPPASPSAFIHRSAQGIKTSSKVDDDDDEDKLSAQPSPVRLSSSLPAAPTAYPPFLTSTKVAKLTEDSISVLPQKLFLLSLRNENGDQCLRTLLQLAFFSSG